MAIIEYLDETHPQPPLMPKDPKDAPACAGSAQSSRATVIPCSSPASATISRKELKVDEAARTRWCQHWVMEALKAVEAHLSKEKETGRYCHGNVLARRHLRRHQVFGARSHLRHGSGADGDARIQRVHEARGVRQVASTQAARCAEGNKALRRDESR